MQEQRRATAAFGGPFIRKGRRSGRPTMRRRCPKEVLSDLSFLKEHLVSGERERE